MHKFRIKIIGLIMLLGIQSVALGAGEVSPPAMISETLACTYREGKNDNDVLKVRDFIVSQADQSGLMLPPSFLWTLVEGDIDIDYVWFNVYLNRSVFTTLTDARKASIGPAVIKRFASVSECTRVTSEAQMIFPVTDPAGAVPAGPVFIAAHSCRYINPTSQKDMEGLLLHMREFMQGMAGKAPAFTTALQYFSGTSVTSDVVLYSGYESAVSRDNFVRELRNTKAGQRLMMHKKRVLDCAGPTLWSSQLVVPVKQ